jgi:hypothetical protein
MLRHFETHILLRKRLLDRLAEVGVQVVEHEMNAPRHRVSPFEQVSHEGYEIRLGAMIGNRHGPSSALGLYCHQQVAGAMPHVPVIRPRGLSGFDWQGRARILHQLFAYLVQTDYTPSRPERRGIQIPQIVHSLSLRCRPVCCIANSSSWGLYETVLYMFWCIFLY